MKQEQDSISKNKIKISLSRRLYSLTAAKEAVATLAEIARFKISEQKNSLQVEIDNIPKDAEADLEYEFCNWVLFFMKG